MIALTVSITEISITIMLQLCDFSSITVTVNGFNLFPLMPVISVTVTNYH